MMQLRQVLVATDFSEASDVAMNYGRALAQTFGASLHLLHVAGNTFLHPTPADPHQTAASTAKRLGERLTADDRATLHATAAIKTSDNAAEEIVKYARAHHIDVIVVGTHGRGPLARVLIGSVAERVVRTAPCPVLTVRHPERNFVMPDATEPGTHQRPGGRPS
jgi:nucleotide-binding universal stress UspA family protein